VIVGIMRSSGLVGKGMGCVVHVGLRSPGRAFEEQTRHFSEG
jgi:hypothetical protein